MSEPVPSCPECGEELYRVEVDIGIGVQCGPWGCGSCGYSEAPELDRTRGTNDQTQRGGPDRWTDQWGVSHSRTRLAENLSRLGLPGEEIVDEVFEKPGSEAKP